jgi:hypothetical protein
MKHYTTTHSTGLQAKRSTKNKTYAWAVWVTRTPDNEKFERERTRRMLIQDIKRLKDDLEADGYAVRRSGKQWVLDTIASQEASLEAVVRALETNAPPAPWCEAWRRDRALAESYARQLHRQGLLTELSPAVER